VIDNVVWTDSWPSIAGAGCSLICVGAGEERARKVYALWVLQVERQVGLTRGTQWPAGQVWDAWWQEKQDEVVDRSRCRVAVQNQSLHAGFAAVHHKTGRVTWLSHKTKAGGSAGRDGIRARREASKQRTRIRIARFASRLSKVRSPGICLMVLQRHIPKMPLVGVYLSLNLRGILAFRLSPYKLRGEMMGTISRNPSSFALAFFPSYFP
jgi:hypothetical protein